MTSRLSYRRARSIILLAGLVVVTVVVGTMLLRGVDPVEVWATLLFAPVFAAAVFFGLPGGGIAGAAAATAYLLLRLPAVSLVGLAPLFGLLASRVLGLVAFGLVSGWAASVLQGAVEKLELYDEVDDETGLGNARSVLHVVDTERSRADRYQKVFSFVVARFEETGWAGSSSRQRRSRLRELGSAIRESVRESDHVAHARSGDLHLLALVLPETGGEGARTVAENLRSRLASSVGSAVSTTVLTYPGEEAELAGQVEQFRAIDEAARRPGT